MRIQMDLEIKQKKLKDLNEKYDVIMFSTQVR